MNSYQKVKNQLELLYGDKSKHSSYQNIPEFVSQETGFKVSLNEEWRGDTARYNLLRETVEFQQKTVIEIGANTGFFALSFARANPSARIIAYEGNPVHAEFIQLIIDSFSVKNCKVVNEYVGFEDIDDLPKSDMILHFNVLHHAGADFDQKFVSSTNELMSYLTNSFNKLRNRTSKLIFQMGYNWGGNKQFPIFGEIKLGNMHKALIEVFKSSNWDCEGIGVASKDLSDQILIEQIIYPINERDIESVEESQTAISEFYKRPIYFLGPI